MSVAVLVVVIAVVVSGLSYRFESSHHTGDHLADPVESTQWLVRRLSHRPRLARLAHRRLDRRNAAGFLVTSAFVIVLGSALIVGLMFDLADNGNGLGGADRWLSSWGSRHTGHESTEWLERITELGATTVGLLVLGVVAAIDFVRHRNLHVFSFVALVGVGQWLLVNGLKVLVRRDRPDLLQLVSASGFSFPSGHSAAAAACWAAAAFVLTRRASPSVRLAAGSAAVTVAVAVAASRSLLGVHWLSDVIAGTAIGWAWTSLMILAFSREIRPLAPLALRVGAAADPVGPVADLPAAGGRPT